MKKSLQKLINSFLDRVQLELKPIYLHCGKEEYLKVRKKDIRGNYKFLVKKGAISLKRNPDGNGLIATKTDQKVIPFFSLYPDYNEELLILSVLKAEPKLNYRKIVEKMKVLKMFSNKGKKELFKISL